MRACRQRIFGANYEKHHPQSLIPMLRAIHFSPLPCSDLGQGVAISTTALMLPRFFVQTHIFSVSPSSFSL